MNRTSLFLTLLLTLAGGIVAYGIDLTWFTFDGGDMFTTGGTYALSGTIGQPDANSGTGGGQFGLVSRSWVASDAAGAAPPLADQRFDAEGAITAIGHVIQVRPEPHPASAWRS